MTAFSNVDAIELACRVLGLNASLTRVMIDTARPTVWLKHGGSTLDANLPVRTSKVGGEPDLPAELAWPTRPPVADSKRAAHIIEAAVSSPDAKAFANFAIDLLDQTIPMAFLAQIDLGAMAREPGFDPMLPDRGMLWAFNDPFAEWYGPQSPSGGIILLWSDADGLKRRKTPALIREAWQRGVSDFGHPMPEPWEADVRAEPLSPVSGWTVSPRLDRMAYLKLCDERWEMEGGGGDQLGGWEDPIQQAMHGNVEMIRTGVHDSDRGQTVDMLSAGERWRHVLTINAETSLWRLMPTWGDGAMYTFVDENDLAARRFDRAASNAQMT